MSRNVSYIGIAVILVGVIVAIYFYNLGREDLSLVKPEYEMTADELYYEFSENQETASEKYINKVLQVSGILDEIEIISDSTLNLVLKTSESPGSVICSFEDPDNIDQSSLTEGQEVIVKGLCSGMTMDVLLINCKLIKP